MQTTPNSSCFFLPSSSNSQVKTCMFEYLAYISTWTAANHLKLNLSKTELLFNLGKTALHGPVNQCRGCHGIAFISGKESGHNPQQQTVLHPQYHCCGPILQICPLQHPQDLVFPHKRHSATPGPSPSEVLMPRTVCRDPICNVAEVWCCSDHHLWLLAGGLYLDPFTAVFCCCAVISEIDKTP